MLIKKISTNLIMQNVTNANNIQLLELDTNAQFVKTMIYVKSVNLSLNIHIHF
jgi:hypothetical protein